MSSKHPVIYEVTIIKGKIKAKNKKGSLGYSTKWGRERGEPVKERDGTLLAQINGATASSAPIGPDYGCAKLVQWGSASLVTADTPTL